MKQILSALFIGLSISSFNAHADAFHWSSIQVDTAELKHCYGMTEAAMKQTRFSEVKKAKNEVTGRYGDVYIAVTCTATKPKTTAIIMAIGNHVQETIRVRDTIRERIQGMRVRTTPARQ